MSVLALSGWGQPADALAAIAPDAVTLDYAKYHSVHDALVAIAEAGKDARLVIGWSLGGQLAVRAVAAGMLKPKALVLIAAPFQFVESPDLPLGMKMDLHEKFRANYVQNPLRTISKSWELIAKDDVFEAKVRDHLLAQDKQDVLKHDWLGWLDTLAGYSCKELSFHEFPETLVIHGDRDLIVAQAQAKFFVERLPKSKSLMLTGCNHAPHWHQPELVKALIKSFADV